MHTVGAVFVHWLALLLVIHNMLCHVSLYSCPQGCRISVSRRSQDPLRPRSRLGLIGKRLGLGIKGLGLGIGLGQLGLVHKSFFAGMLYFLFIQNAIMWPQPLVLFAQLDSLPCRRPLHYRPTVFIQQKQFKKHRFASKYCHHPFCLLSVNKNNFYKYKKKKNQAQQNSVDLLLRNTVKYNMLNCWWTKIEGFRERTEYVPQLWNWEYHS